MPSSLLLTDKVINDTFELFDTDGAGVLDLDSFNLALSSLGLGLNAAETEKLFSSESEDSPVSKAEFKKIVKTWNKNVTFHSEVQRMFGEFANGKDNINSAAFADVHEQIGWTDANDKIVRFIQESTAKYGDRNVDSDVWMKVMCDISGQELPGAEPEEDVEEF